MNPDDKGVAPFVGVWIEILSNYEIDTAKRLSLPSWECGLKLTLIFIIIIRKQSPPSGECGLK